jgi:hypothetical protein
MSAQQASALLRSGLAIAAELIGNAFSGMSKTVLDELSGRWDFDVGAPLVQRLLTIKSAALQDAFRQRLQEHQDAALNELMSVRTQATALVMDATSLSLVEANALDNSTIIERTAGKIRGRVDDGLRDLNLVVAHLAGRSQVRVADNPYGPDVFVRALLDAAEDTSLHAEAWDYFLASFEKPLAEELARIYGALIDHFRTHGLDPVAIRRSLAPRAVGGSAAHQASRTAAAPGEAAPPPPTMGGAGSAGGGAGGYQGARPATIPAGGYVGGAGGGAGQLVDASAVLDNLLARLQANAHGYRPPQLPSPGPADAPLLDAINELQHLGLEGVQGAVFAGTPAGSLNAWREHLISQSTRTVDKLTIELVGMLFDHVMQDKQVPAEIKAIISRLQFPVLKAALLDADFFASGTHPARRLIDRIASTSVGWEPYGDENEHFRTEIERVVREVLMKFDKDLSIFEKVLAEFESFVGDINPRDNDPVARAKRALEEAEKREILAINTTIQVRRAFERVELEPYLRDFLVGPWVQVLVSAALRDGQTPGFSKSFRETIHDIVWSVQPKATADERRRLVEMIPNITRVLRDGLSMIRMPEREAAEFFQKLMASHAMAVKPVDQATYIKSSLATSELRSRVEGMQMTGSFPITTVAGGIKVSTNALMRVAEEHDAQLVVPDPVTEPMALDRVQEARLDEDIASWQRGSWFELWNGTEFVKARLRWISPLRTLFMFSSGKDNAAHVMAPELIKSYLNRGYLKPLETTPLTKRAVDGLVGEFERMPKFAEELASRYQPA